MQVKENAEQTQKRIMEMHEKALHDNYNTPPPGYKMVIKGFGRAQIVREQPRDHMSKKERRRLREQQRNATAGWLNPVAVDESK